MASGKNFTKGEDGIGVKVKAWPGAHILWLCSKGLSNGTLVSLSNNLGLLLGKEGGVGHLLILIRLSFMQ